MRKQLLLAALLLASSLLVACDVTVEIDGLPPGLDVYDTTYATDWQADIDGRTRNVICYDRDTNLSYSFRFDGSLYDWTSYLRGVETGDEAGRVNLDLDDSRVDYRAADGEVTVNYLIRANAAPYLVAPEAIVPTPRVRGYTKLFLEFDNANEPYPFTTNNIPVLASCG